MSLPVPVYQVQSLVSDVRTDSDLNASQVYTDAQIATLISDAGSDLYDKFTAANQHYNISTFDFTLAGGVGGNTVTLPADFQQGHSVDVNPDTAQPYTLRYLSNWLDRNRLNLAPFAVWGPGGGPRVYYIQGSSPATLTVLPAMGAAGIFRLYYTPMWTALSAPVPVSDLTPGVDGAITVTPATDHTNAPSSYVFTAFPHGGFAGQQISTSGWANAANNGIKLVTAFNAATSTVTVGETDIVTETAPAGVKASLLLYNQSGGTWSMLGFTAAQPQVGDTLVVSGSQFSNGSRTILTVNGTTVTTSATGLTTPENFGAGVTVTIQRAGTRPDLPTFMNPWVLYLKTLAAITIRNKRGQDVNALMIRLKTQEDRIEAILQNRVEEPQQPPLTRNSGFWGGW